MAEIIQIERDGVIQYPITKPECVIDENGKNLKTQLTELSTEVGKCNVGAVDTNESVEEPEDKHATIEYVNNAIAAAITTTLNEEV